MSEIIKAKVKCDVPICKNIALILIQYITNLKTGSLRRIYLCKEHYLNAEWDREYDVIE